MKLRNLFAKKDEEYKNIDKKELKEIKKKYDNYKVEELTEEELINLVKMTYNDSGKQIRIQNEKGNIISDGSIVTGSNGEKYRFQNINVEEDLTTVEQKLSTGRDLLWSIHNINKEYALASAAVAILLILLGMDRKKEMTNMTGDQIEKLVMSAKDKFDSESEFANAVEKITKKRIDQLKIASARLKGELISQSITVDDVNNLGGIKK